MAHRKGIILAGGTGSRLYPITLAVSKQLLPVYDKPMIYYPLTVLMLAGIKNILLITSVQDQFQFKNLLGDGSQWGINLEYKVQLQPDGLAQALILAEKFLDGSPSAMILGDNIFFGQGLSEILKKVSEDTSGACVFAYQVADPERYGVAGFDDDGKINSIVEKPTKAPSDYAITGLYFFDNTAYERAKLVKPSSRGELEITDVLVSYLHDNDLNIETMGRGFAWLDTGTPVSLLDASNFVHTLTKVQKMQLGSPDEVAYNNGWLSTEQLEKNSNRFHNSAYGKYLKKLKK